MRCGRGATPRSWSARRVARVLTILLEVIPRPEKLSYCGRLRSWHFPADKFEKHGPQKSVLSRLLDPLPASPHVDVRIATACFLGYGLPARRRWVRLAKSRRCSTGYASERSREYRNSAAGGSYSPNGTSSRIRGGTVFAGAGFV